MEVSLTQFCAALIAAFSYATVVFVWIVGLVTAVDILLHKSIVPAMGRIFETVSRMWPKRKEQANAKV